MAAAHCPSCFGRHRCLGIRVVVIAVAVVAFVAAVVVMVAVVVAPGIVRPR